MTFNKPSMNGLNHFSIQDVNDEIDNLENNKQNNLTAGTNITINGNEISSTDTNTEYTAGTNVSISAGNVISATDTNTEYTAGTNVSISAGNVISSTDTNTEYTAGTNVSISAGNVISSTDTNTTYSAQSNGGLAVNGSNQFSLDFTNTNSKITIPQRLEITNDTVPQLLIKPTSTNASKDARVILRGARSSSTSVHQAQLDFENYDDDAQGGNGATMKLGSIHARVSNSTNNIGGLVFNSYANGSTRTGSLTMSNIGNWNLGNGTTFQDDYKLKINGDIFTNGSSYIKPQLRMLGYDKDNLNLPNIWGNGSSQRTINYDRQVGESFLTTDANGVITLTKDGYYKIKVSAQTQSDAYNNRISFMNYLRIVRGSFIFDYDEDEEFNFFGWIYNRLVGDGGHGSSTFEDYIYLETNNTIQVRHKLETTVDRLFDNTLPSNNIDNYLNITIERIYDTNPEE